MRFKCPHCDKGQECFAGNTVIYIFEAQVQYNHIEFACECGGKFRVLGLNHMINEMDPALWPIIAEEKAPPDVREAYRRLFLNETLSSKDTDTMTKFKRILKDISSIHDIEWGK